MQPLLSARETLLPGRASPEMDHGQGEKERGATRRLRHTRPL